MGTSCTSLFVTRVHMSDISYTATGLMAAPVAAVAETFEYDVLRALNNPLVVNRAQRHFGQQLLSHLRTLDWGFRFGGTVINAKLVMNVVMALTITMVTTVSQAFFTTIPGF